MKKAITPIAMKCSKEQFKLIKPKLKKIGKICTLIGAFKENRYLTNNYGNTAKTLLFDFVQSKSKWAYVHRMNIHETWNEKVFLNACGIETEPEYVITESRIQEIAKMNTAYGFFMEYTFPDAFKEEKICKIGKWNKSYNGCLVFFINNSVGYGFDAVGNWMEEQGGFNLNDDHFKWSLCEDSEITQALTKEAVKRRYKEAKYIKCLEAEELIKTDFDFWTAFKDGEYWLGGCLIFKDGKWAEIIPTITKAEAEKKLDNKFKIID